MRLSKPGRGWKARRSQSLPGTQCVPPPRHLPHTGKEPWRLRSVGGLKVCTGSGQGGDGSQQGGLGSERSHSPGTALGPGRGSNNQVRFPCGRWLLGLAEA